MNHAQLLNAAKASRIPLPPPDHEKYDLVVRAQANAELMRREAKRTSEQDLYFFCTAVLGYAEMYEPLHRPLCEFVSSEKKSSLTLIPRGHFKSTIISVSYPLWLLCKFPDTRILLANATLDNPRKWVQEQQTHLKENAVLRWMYPEMCPTEEDIQQFGYSWHYTVRNRSPGCPWGEASVEVCSIERNVVSRHYETIIYDDIVSEENSRSKIGLDRTEEFYKSSQALLQGEVEGESKWKVAPVHTRCVGTRWNYGDLWGLLIERGMPHLVRQAIEDDAAIFSTMFSVERLNQIREEMGSSLFASQYMNDPIDADNAVFSRDHTAYYSTVNPKDLSISITVDLAIDEKESADDTAIVVTGVDDAGCIFVLDYSNGKYLPSKTVSEIYRLYDLWKARYVYFESHGFQRVMAYILHEEGKKRGQFIPARPVPAKGSKYSRILALQPFHERGHLRFKRDMSDLDDQLHRYPRVRHDDVIDALAMRVSRMVWKQSLTRDEGVEYGRHTFAGQLKRLDERNERRGEVTAERINPTRPDQNLMG